MGTTKKIIGAVALITGVFIIGGSYWTGKSVEKTFRAGAEGMAEYGFLIKQIDYRRGIFSATAHTEWELLPEWGLMFPEGEPLTVSYKHDIRHGPVFSPTAAASIRSELMLSEELVAALINAFGDDSVEGSLAAVLADGFSSDPFDGKAPLTIETTIGWSGGRHARIVSPGIEFPAEEGQSRFSWGGLDGEIAMDSTYSKMKASIVMGGLTVIGSNEDQIQIGRTIFRIDVEQPAGYEFTPVGTVSFVQDRLWSRTMDENTGAMSEIALDNTRIEVNATIVNDVQDGRIRFDADKIVMRNGAIAIEKPGATFLFENFDAQVNEAIQKVRWGQGGESVHHAFLREQAKAFLQRQPAITIKDLSAHWPEGMMTGNLRVAYVGDSDPMRFSPSDLAVAFQFSLPRTLAIRLLEMQAATKDVEREQNDMLNTMIQNGVLIEKDGALSIDANFKDGALILNGQSSKPFGVLQELLRLF
ncbi:MAG: YdgA family protein [Burkholderiales bacterium]|nr:YdgA family protein [Burkholderiales bacterium]